MHTFFFFFMVIGYLEYLSTTIFLSEILVYVCLFSSVSLDFFTDPAQTGSLAGA